MIDMVQIIKNRAREIMSTWDETDIYAVSFFVYAIGAYTYGGFENVSEFHVSYNAESDCPGAGKCSEERWNYAYWRQETTPVIDPYDPTPETKLLFDWYRQQGLENIGYEDEEGEHGPVGNYELLMAAADAARQLQEEGFLREKVHRPIPIIVHDLEYCDDVFEATRIANPNGEAADFLEGSWLYGNEDPDGNGQEEFDFVFGDLLTSITDTLSQPDKLEQLLGITKDGELIEKKSLIDLLTYPDE